MTEFWRVHEGAAPTECPRCHERVFADLTYAPPKILEVVETDGPCYEMGDGPGWNRCAKVPRLAPDHATPGREHECR